MATILTENREKLLLQEFIVKIDFKKVLLKYAQRRAYGAPPKNHDLYSDETLEAIWAWELVTPTLFLEPPSFFREAQQVRESL